MGNTYVPAREKSVLHVLHGPAAPQQGTVAQWYSNRLEICSGDQRNGLEIRCDPWV